jgi:RNA polymerase sigma-70 factor (ECF subfamily)
MERIDTQRLQQLIDAHGATLLLYARQWCDAPEDALQESLIELLRQTTVPTQPVAWLFKTIRCRAMNLARAERRRTAHHRRAAESRDMWFLDDPDAAFDSAELAGMLEQLPALEREVVVARTWGELSFEQIGTLVGSSSSAAHRRYRRALALLGSMMNGKLNKSEQNHERRPQSTV